MRYLIIISNLIDWSQEGATMTNRFNEVKQEQNKKLDAINHQK